MASSKPAARKKAPALDTDMLVDLHRSGLDEEDVEILELEHCSTAPTGITPAAAGYIIPYFDTKGRRTSFFRYRYLEDTRTGFEKLSGEKQRRYTQPLNTTPQVYWPPYIDWAEYIKGSDPLIITEGEKKAARVTKGGIPTIGLGGVWSFQNAAKNESLLPALHGVEWEGREVFIIYDSDAVDKIQIQQAEYRLARRLLTVGAQVYIARLPHGEAGAKRGLDDFVQDFGIEALQELCAKTEAFEDSEALHLMSTEVAYVKDPGIVYVIETGQLVAPADFKAHRFADRIYTKAIPTLQGTRLEERSTAADWLKWPARNAVERLEFEPGEPSVTPEGALNLWRGWRYVPRPGPVDYWHRLLDHIFRDEPANRKWFEQWAAYPFQHPGAKLINAVAIWGRMKGTGKSAIGYTLGGLYGDAFREIGDNQIEKNDFNSWAKNCQFVLGDDITGSGNRRVANVLKTMISRERLEINTKHVAQYFTRDCINYLFTSNSPDAFLLDEDDRRFFVHEVVSKPMADSFYIELTAWRKSERGRQALMHYMMNVVDCSGFIPTARPPMTRAKQEMIEMTRTDLESWLTGIRADPDPFCRKFGDCDLVTVPELMLGYDPQQIHRVTAVTFARKLKELGINRCDPSDKEPGAQIRVAPNGDLVRLYALRNYDKWGRATTLQLRKYYEDSRKLVSKGPKKF
jgi:hypothetical protein